MGDHSPGSDVVRSWSDDEDEDEDDSDSFEDEDENEQAYADLAHDSDDEETQGD